MKSFYSYWLYKILFPIMIFFVFIFSFTVYYFFKEIYIYRTNSLLNTAQIVASLSRDAILTGDEFELYKNLSKIVKTNELIIHVHSIDNKLNIKYPPFSSQLDNYSNSLQVRTNITSQLGDTLGEVIVYEKKMEPFEYRIYLILSLIIISVFLFLFKNMRKLINDFKKLDELLNNTWIDDNGLNLIYFQEFKNIYQKVLKLTNSLLLKEKEQSEKNQKMVLGSIVKQVAHDIRSPLTVLNMITSSLDEVPQEKKELIRSSIQRINDIANDLLLKGKKNESEYVIFPEIDTFKSKNFLLHTVLESIVSEKRVQYKNKLSINIIFKSYHYFRYFCQLNPSDLKRVLSNLINNSAEAIGSKSGAVEVSLDSNSEFAIIKIKDNGPGIPPHILEKLGNESVSYGKDSTDSGSGLGVLHAKKTIESMQGQFSITSKLGVGTEVTISLPLAEKPIWFLDTLKLKEKSTVLICDDDSSIIALWKKRLSDFSSISAYYFTDLVSLSSFLMDNPDLNFALLIDYEFSGEQKTGLDFIIENQLASKAVLVTSHYEEDKIIQSCLEYGIKQIPKNICALVPIEMANYKEYYDSVVLDDEDLQIRSWQFAAIQKGKKILTFSKSDEFLSALSNIDHQSCIFIDSILSESTKGEDIATKVNAMGFTNIYMSSGHDPSYFKDMKFLKGIIGKTPYFP